MTFLKKITDIVHDIIKDRIEEGDVVIDATIGNGNDTLFLADLVGNTGKVYGFDIQNIAIKNTKHLLKVNDLLHRTEIINDCHSKIQQYVSNSIKAAVFNLGYLPKGDKTIITQFNTTKSALKQCLNLLMKKGIIVITSYYGHEGGMEEKNCLDKYLKNLHNKQYSVVKLDFYNKTNFPPIIYIIEKI